MFTRKVLTRTSAGRFRIKMPYGSGDMIESLASLYWERYHAPLFIAETAATGSVRRRRLWLEASIEAVQRTRSSGLPLIGYTWWPLFALVTWSYRQGTRPAAYYLKQMGLWDLDSELKRIPTTLVSAYRDLVRHGTASAGFLSPALGLNTPQMATNPI